MTTKKLTLANNPLFAGPGLRDRERIGSPYRELALDQIDSDPNQPRKTFDDTKLSELADSIKAYGVLSPILVRPSQIPGRFNIVSGERRYRASKIAGKVSIPAMIDTGSETNHDRTLAIQLVENLQRDDLSSLERAQAIGALRDAYHLSVRDIAEKLGVSKSMVHRSLEILDLPDDLLSALRDGASESKVLLLSKISDPEVRAGYLKDLDVVTRASLEQRMGSGTTSSAPRDQVVLNPEDQRVVDEIQRALGLKVRMIKTDADSERGRLMIEFYSQEDLKELFRKLMS